MAERDDILKRYEAQSMTTDKAVAIDHNRAAHIELVNRMCDWLPESREKSLCLTALQESLMWANSAIAQHLPT